MTPLPLRRTITRVACPSALSAGNGRPGLNFECRWEPSFLVDLGPDHVEHVLEHLRVAEAPAAG